MKKITKINYKVVAVQNSEKRSFEIGNSNSGTSGEKCKKGRGPR